MEQYLEKGREVLKILINNGCEAYMIGEAVCNLIKGLPYDKIDITTNATPDMVKGIFSNAKVEDAEAGTVLLTYMGYDFKIRTFRLEEKYKDNRKPLRLHYSKNLKDELAACDFTINAIAMSYGGKLTDAYKGYEDIKKKKIRTIGSAKVRFSENAIRMLIAIRLVSELGFKIERKTYVAIKRKAKLLKNVEPSLMEDELRRIFGGKYFKRAISYLIDTKLHKYIPDLKKGLYYFAKNPKRKSIDTILACSYVLNKQYLPTWENLSDNPERLRNIVDLALANPKKIDLYSLFNYGLEIYLDSNYVLYLLRKSKNKAKKIKKVYENLPIKEISELQFTRNDFYSISKKSHQYIDIIYKDVITKVLSKELPNDYQLIKQYVIKALTVYNIYPGDEDTIISKPFKEYDDYVYSTEETDKVERVIEQEVKPITNQEKYIKPEELSTLEQIQQKVSEFEKSLREKDERIKELERQALEYKLDNDVNAIVGQNLELLKDLNYLDKDTEKYYITKELKKVYKGLIKNFDPKYQSLFDEKEGNEIKNESKD